MAPPDIRVLTSGAFAAQANVLLAAGLAPMAVADALFEVAASLIAGVEPSSARQIILDSVARSFPTLVTQLHLARNTTPGGIVIPGR